MPYTIHWGAAVGDISENSRYVKKAEGLLFQDGKVRRLTPKDFASQPTYEGDFGYAGVDDNYFMTVALFPGPSKVTYQAVSIPPPANSKDPARDLVAYAIEPQTTGAQEVLCRAEGLRRARRRSIAMSSARSISACSRSSSCRCCGR